MRRCAALCPFGDVDGLIRCARPEGHEPPHRNKRRRKQWRDAPKTGRHYRSGGRLVPVRA